ncbi:hypothetical protein B0H16DRAFT_1734449 [Mycena metata]|uniref:Uncharacterized protein n=1 Tax=Mycena metata TaxID=1033252 RepID=A0AAD7HUV6_9AGAR|nr:hypothetical protein B0H16DRAFT_1734449 [Mycena metata]
MPYTRWKLLALLSDICTLIAVTYPLCILAMRFIVTHFSRIEPLATGLGISPTYCAAYLHVLTHILVVQVLAINVGLCVMGVACVEGYRVTVWERREGIRRVDGEDIEMDGGKRGPCTGRSLFAIIISYMRQRLHSLYGKTGSHSGNCAMSSLVLARMYHEFRI